MAPINQSDLPPRVTLAPKGNDITMRVGIVGAGIGGLMTAIALLEGGHEVEIFEKSQFSKEVGAAVTAPPNASRILDYFGFDFNRAKATPAESIIYHDDAENLGNKAIFPVSDYKSKYGFAWHIFHRIDIHDELRKLATEPSPSRKEVARLHLSTPVLRVDLDGTIHLSDGTTVQKDLVVAADGVRSSIISTVLGEEVPCQHFMTMSRLLLPTEQMSNDADTKAFFEGGYNRVRVIRVEDGSMITYGCRNGTLQNIAFMYPKEDCDDAAVKNEPKTGSHGAFLKEYPAFVQSLASKANGIGKWKLQVRQPLGRFARGRLVVVGDAAHPMPPLRAQGASMALEDAAALGVLLSGLKTLEDVPARLEIFNDLRVKRVATVQLMSSQRRKWDPRNVPEEYVHYFGGEIPEDELDLERSSCDYNVIKEAFEILHKVD